MSTDQLSLQDKYALSAARGMVRSMEYYRNSSPAVGDGKVSTPAYYANMLHKVVHMRGDHDAIRPTSPERTWWGYVWLDYAHSILAGAFEFTPGMFDHLPTKTAVDAAWLAIRATVPQWHDDGKTRATLARIRSNRLDSIDASN
ncbi:Uncharacterised protein [Mycobacteroides abscessus subsp. abscessus]|nr:Uncharacterised protein [Mycobacteroides abscessus subsp. abscessus]